MLILVGWGLTLLLTVHLTNRIASNLRRNRARLRLQNQRVRSLARRLQRQKRAMIQHEKTVAMGQMAAGVAHEIANPLASMDSLIQLMQRHPKHMSTDKLTALSEQVDRINNTVRQLTNFAHPTDHQVDSVGLNGLVEAGLDMVRFDRRHKDVPIE
jgi:two-component system sensor histidine kinase AtoS